MTSKTVGATSEAWITDAPLIIGAQPDGQRGFVGTFYLVAIHDQYFTQEMVTRHYQAGPSAK